MPFEILAKNNISQLSNQPCLILLFMYLLVRSSSRIQFFYFLTLVLASKARFAAFGSIFCVYYTRSAENTLVFDFVGGIYEDLATRCVEKFRKFPWGVEESLLLV